MPTKVQIKRSTVSGRTPNTTSSSNTTFIATGELAINLTDKKLFSSDGTNLIEFGSGTPVYDENGTLLTNTYITSTDLTALTVSPTPASSNTYDLGGSSNKWRDVYISGDVIMSGTVGNTYIDTSSTDASYANGAQVHFPNFSGMVVVNNTGTTGQIMMVICGGGSVGVLGYSGTGLPHKTGTMYANGTNNGYTWVNDSGATDTFNFAAIRTRTTG